jgi:hypothetical protein
MKRWMLALFAVVALGMFTTAAHADPYHPRPRRDCYPVAAPRAAFYPPVFVPPFAYARYRVAPPIPYRPYLPTVRAPYAPIAPLGVGYSGPGFLFSFSR